MTNSISEWNANDISFDMGGIEIPDFVDISYANKEGISHIKATNKGPTGYNITYPEPRFQVSINATSAALTTLNRWKKEHTYINFTYKAPGLVVKGYDCLIEDINPGRIAEKVPVVVVTGLALKIEEDWNPVKVDGAGGVQEA